MLQHKKNPLYRCPTRVLTLLCAGILFLSQGISAHATNAREESIIAHQAMTVESNEVANWPEGPVVSAESAILMDADTGVILYSKNIHLHQYPASTTKILTTLIASEQCSLDEIVTFSHDAVFGTPRDSNHIAMNERDTLTMEQCLNAILIRSANEVSYAVAEHISGTWDAFADLMNERAKELGCVDSHFVNPNGLPDENHYTSAYDLAMIGRAFFDNEMLCKITTTPKLVIPKAKEDLVEWNKMKLLPQQEYAYEYLVGCKTGYTEAARNALVSCAEKDGLKLICVVLNDEDPYHYEDTIALFNYGFGNFDKVNISQTETKYNIDNTGSFYSNNDIFGNSEPILSLNKEDCIILPKTVNFSDTVSKISYDTEDENQAALITYTYHDVYIGCASVDLTGHEEGNPIFNNVSDNAEAGTENEEVDAQPSFVFINIVKVFLWMAGLAFLFFLLFFIRVLRKNFEFSPRNNRRTWRRDRRKRPPRYHLRSNASSIGRKAGKRQKAKKPNRFRDYDF